MDPLRLASLISVLEADQRDGLPVGNRLCGAAVDLLGVEAAGITLITDEGQFGAFGVSGAMAADAEELQYTLGQGPCIDTHAGRSPVFEVDLADPLVDRWPDYRAAAVALGIGAVFGFPLGHEEMSFGVLDLYRRDAGALQANQVSDARILCELVTHTILALQADMPVGVLAPEVGGAFDRHAVLHRASGLVASELGLPVHDAYVRIRAHAYAINRRVTEVAEAIVNRELRLG